MANLGPNDLVLSSVPLMDRPLLKRLAPARAAGFTAVSLLPTDFIELAEQGLSAKELGERVRGEGLEISEIDGIANWLPAHGELELGDALLKSVRNTHAADRVLDAAGACGARSVTVVEMFGVRPSLDEAIEAFAGLCDKGAERGLLVHIEFLPFGGIPDLATALAIVSGAGRKNGGLAIDSWHLFRSGGSVADLARVPGELVHTVQLNDAPAQPWPNMWEETMNGRLLPGEGSFDLTAMIQTLAAIGSQAPFEIEVMNARQAGQSTADIASEWGAALRATLALAQGKN